MARAGRRQPAARLSPAGPAARPGRCPLTSSTPDALWASRSVRLLRPAAVEIHGLRRPRGRSGGLRGLDLSVPVGARLLLIARPEATGSLLLRILSGLARPADGSFSVAGVARGAAGWSRRIAYVGPEPAEYRWLTPAEALALAGRLAGYDRDEVARRAAELLDRFGIRGAERRPISRGGPGLAQKVALAVALLTDPEVLLLDEPLRSLDPIERAELLALGERRTTLLLASRYPAGEAGLVDQVALIRGGRLALHVPVAELEAHGLSLSSRGVDVLADLRATQPSVYGRRRVPPAAAGG